MTAAVDLGSVRHLGGLERGIEASHRSLRVQ
jgi:hypothetical protein